MKKTKIEKPLSSHTTVQSTDYESEQSIIIHTSMNEPHPLLLSKEVRQNRRFHPQKAQKQTRQVYPVRSQDSGN